MARTLTTGRFTWVEDHGQKVWLWIALWFAAFYFAEAFLFWGPQPRIIPPPFTPLIYWGAFGAGIIWLVQRHGKSTSRIADQPPAGLQAFVLGSGITVSVVGMAFLVMRLTGNVTLGHAILLGAMFEAGIVIAGISGNVGWFAGSLAWAAGALAVLRWPHVQDYTLGLAMAVGLILVGLLRKCARAPVYESFRASRDPRSRDPQPGMEARSAMIHAKYKHTNIIARNWQSLAAFYETVFGCVRVPPPRDLAGEWLSRGTGVPDAGFMGVHLRLPGHGDAGPTLEIYQYSRNEPRAATAANREGIMHLAFEVADVQAAVDEVVTAGGGMVGDVATAEVPGVGLLTFTYVADPEGNILELQSWG